MSSEPYVLNESPDDSRTEVIYYLGPNFQKRIQITNDDVYIQLSPRQAIDLSVWIVQNWANGVFG